MLNIIEIQRNKEMRKLANINKLIDKNLIRIKLKVIIEFKQILKSINT